MRREEGTMNAFPPGIKTARTQLPNGVAYEFSHKRLGRLGRLIITGTIDNQTQVSAEIAPGEVSDPKWVERFEMLQTIVQKCMDALPGENKPLPNMEEARKRVTLYRRFLAVDNSLQMEQFAKSLTQDEQEALFEMIDNGISSNLHMQDVDNLYGIAQRDTDLRQFLMSNK